MKKNITLAVAIFIMFVSSNILYAHEGEGKKQIVIVTTEYRFSPDNIELLSGEPVELHISNDGKITHEFVAEILKGLEVIIAVDGVVIEGMLSEVEIPIKKNVIISFTPEKKGAFKYFCKVRNHKNMTGTMNVK